jgi:peptide/nickel transport system substrate-binding protein
MAALAASLPYLGREAFGADKEVLRIGANAEVLTLDRSRPSMGPIFWLKASCSRLRRVPREGAVPGARRSWTISEDGKTYTFQLAERRNSPTAARSPPGRGFSYTRMRWQVRPMPGLSSSWKTEATGPKTVVMHLKERFTPFLTLTEIWNSGIVPKAAVQSMGDDKYAQAPVSSGPFRLVEWKKGDRLILEKNPNYYRPGMPYLDGLELIYVPDDNTRVSMLQAGEIDVCMDVPYQLFQALAAQGYRAKADDTSIIQELLINHSAEPFNDMKVRQAASFGIDRQAISDAVTLGMGKPASSLMAPVLDYFNTDLPVPVRDVAKAKALLAEAGKPSVTFELMIAAGVLD